MLSEVESPRATFTCLRCDLQETMRSCSGPGYAPLGVQAAQKLGYVQCGRLDFQQKGLIFPGGKSDFFGILIISALG
jgi:hypothetical protein